VNCRKCFGAKLGCEDEALWFEMRLQGWKLDGIEAIGE